MNRTITNTEVREYKTLTNTNHRGDFLLFFRMYRSLLSLFYVIPHRICKGFSPILAMMLLLAFSACDSFESAEETSRPIDTDKDGIIDVDDNCPTIANQDQADGDKDTFGNVCDNCETIANQDQKNSDANLGEGKADANGDACDDDDDGDGSKDDVDIDDDGDGLIEIGDNRIAEVTATTMLYNIRYNLKGTTYDDESEDTGDGGEGIDTGCGGGIDAEGDPITKCNGYELEDEISLSGIDWTPIGLGQSDMDTFSAILEGNNHTIKGLKISAGDEHLGFFGFLSGTVQNIRFRDGSVKSTNTDFDGSIGAVAGMLNAGMLDNVSSNLTVKADMRETEDIGGLVGQNTGTILNSYTTGKIENSDGEDNIGGLVGKNTGTIMNSYTTGEVSGGDSGENIGGLVGENTGTILNSYARGEVNGNTGGDNIGGFVGSDTGTIVNSYATGNIDGGAGSDTFGRSVGRNMSGSSVTSSYYSNNSKIDGVSGESPNEEASIGVSLTELQSATETDLGDGSFFYRNWSINIWHFGNKTQLPSLRSTRKDLNGNYPLLCGQTSPQVPTPAEEKGCSSQ